MSLQVWLPLTKDLRQQGLSNVTVTNNGATFNSMGKLGGCYYFNGSQQWLQFDTVLGDYYNNDWTVACWLNPTDSTRSVIISEYNGTGASNVAIELTTARIVRLYWGGSPDVYFSTAGALPLNEWTHIVMTKTGRVVKLYFNGELKQTYTSSSDLSTRTSACQPRIGDDYRGNSSNTVSYQGYMNDFRMYDHCLSLMEVKELAKGLVLHYPLNRGGWGQENLLKGNYQATATNSGVSSVGSASIPNGATILMNNKGKTCWFSFDYSTEGTRENGSGSLGERFGCHLSLNYNNASGTAVQNYPCASYLTMSGTGHAVMSFTIPSAMTAVNSFTVACQPNAKPASDNSATWYLKNLKVEIGDKATSWCPHVEDTLATTMGLDSTTEYDCSGYCNNGTRTGTFSWTSDTPKYQVSTQFNGTQYIQVPFSCGVISEAVSVAVWGYESDWNTSSAERLIGAATRSSGWCIGDYGSENTLFAFYANDSYNAATGFKQLSTGWHHFVITFDGLYLNYYVDGQLFSNKTFSTKQIATGDYNIEIGRHYGDSCNFKGRMSDVRIYATALSANDVKSLYQNSAYVDNEGNVYGAVFEEV